MRKVSPKAFQVPRGGRAGHEGHDDGYSAPSDEGYGAPADEGYGAPADEGYGAPEPPPASYGGEPIKILKLTGLDDENGPVEGFNYMYATENK